MGLLRKSLRLSKGVRKESLSNRVCVSMIGDIRELTLPYTDTRVRQSVYKPGIELSSEFLGQLHLNQRLGALELGENKILFKTSRL